MLTSGTTGTPKGAPRQEPGTLTTLGAIFERVPFRTGEVAYVAPPFFHALGFATFNLMLALGNRIVTGAASTPSGISRASPPTA